MADRPLSERLAEIADLPSIGIALTLERRTALAEAVELARRVEAAPVGTVISARVYEPLERARIFESETVEVSMDDAGVAQEVGGKRVALVEVPGG